MDVKGEVLLQLLTKAS